MKTISYKLDIEKLKLNEQETRFLTDVGEKVFFENTLNQGLSNKYPSGMPIAKQKIYSRLLDKLDSDCTGTLEIEEAEFDLIKEVMTSEDAKFHPGQTRLISQYLQAIEAAKAT